MSRKQYKPSTQANTPTNNHWKYYTLPEYMGEKSGYEIHRKSVTIHKTRYVNSFKTIDEAYEALFKKINEGYGVMIKKKIKHNCLEEVKAIYQNIKEKEEELEKNGVEILDFTEQDKADFREENLFPEKDHHIKRINRRIQKGQAIRNSKEENPIKSDEIINRILKMKLEGITYNIILDTIKEEFKCSRIAAAFYYQKTIDVMKDLSLELSQQTLHLHLQRYEDLYNWFQKNNFTKLAIKAMNQREKLIGLHNESVEIEMNTFLLPEQKDIAYEINQLDQGQKIRLGKLLGKAKGID